MYHRGESRDLKGRPFAPPFFVPDCRVVSRGALDPFVSSEVETPLSVTPSPRGISTSLDANGIGLTREPKLHRSRSGRRAMSFSMMLRIVISVLNEWTPLSSPSARRVKTSYSSIEPT